MPHTINVSRQELRPHGTSNTRTPDIIAQRFGQVSFKTMFAGSGSAGSLTVNGGPPAVGRAAIAVTARGFMTAFPDLQVLMDEAIDLGERALYRWTLIGPNTGPGGTGHAVRISGYEEWRLSSDGLIAESLDLVHAETRGCGVLSVVETTAGQGSTLGRSFGEIAAIIAAVKDPGRMAVCIDTCHIFAAGYDTATRHRTGR